MTKDGWVVNPQSKQVALIIETSNEYARGLLKGIRKYKRENREWAIYLNEQSRDNTDLTWLLDWKGDGILARIENDQIADYIIKRDIPTVNLSSFNFVKGLPFVETDDQAIAQIAAEHLLERGIRNFAFCGNSKFNWSKQRSVYFHEYIWNHGYVCYDFDSIQGKFGFEERVKLAEWVKALPKPIGIMACFDRQGQQLLEACRMSKIAVPEDVAVIGVDNDELICELSDPPLSSIIPNSEKAGYQAAELLDKMMKGEKVETNKYLIKPLGIQTRLSTDVLATSDKLIAKSVNFIRNHACDGITVQDVLDMIPLSRRIFENRFYKCVGRTPHDAIITERLKFVKQLLEETDLTMMDIAFRSGFKHTEYLTVAFKREIGVAPSEYRKIKKADAS